MYVLFLILVRFGTTYVFNYFHKKIFNAFVVICVKEHN